MRILITGGAGFQGAHLTEALAAAGHRVTILNTRTPQAEQNASLLAGKADIVWGSVTDPDAVDTAMRNQEVVFHLGARVNVDESIQDPWGTIDVNFRGTYHMLEAARKSGARMIHTSSCEVYGKPMHTPIREDAELRPHSPYAASKAAADRLCFAFSQTFATPVTILRFFNIYGERQHEGRFGAVIPIFVNQAMNGGPITVFGSGQQTRDYLHVQDAVRGYMAVLEHPELAGETINFGTGTGTRIRDLAELIGRSFTVPVHYSEPRPGEVSEMISDSQKAKRLLGWESRITIQEGLERYIGWRKNIPSLSTV